MNGSNPASRSYVVLEYILIPKYKFLRQKRLVSDSNKGTGCRLVEKPTKRGNRFLLENRSAWLISNMESSFLGHTVNALVLTGDEGRDKLR